MIQQDKSITEVELDTQVLSDFIYELNISRRHLSTYPPGHPLIASSTEKVLTLLDQLFEFRETLTLGIAQNALLFEQVWLDKSNPVYRDFAAALSKVGVAAIHFHRHPTADELTSLNQLLRSDRQTIQASGGFETLLPQLHVTHIDITPVDYSALHTTEEDRLEAGAKLQPVWQDLLEGLLEDSLDPTVGTGHKLSKLDPKIVAEILNRKFTDQEQEDEQKYDQVISSFIGKLQTFDQQEQLSSQFGNLVNRLNPELKRQFLNSTFRHLDEQKPGNKEVLDNFPPELVLSSLAEANQNRLNISGTMLNLLGKLSEHHQKDGRQSLTSDQGRQLDHGAEQQLRTIFREEEAEKFTPESYQAALNSIVSFDQEFQLPEGDVANLRESMAESSTERHTSAIIFQLMKNEQSDEQRDGLQNNLIDLARYFLEVGDFVGLRELHCSLIDYRCQRPEDKPDHTASIEAVLHDPDFQQEVLNNLPHWGEEKQKQIRAYIQATGEAYAKMLVSRLSEEPSKSLRRFYLNTLVGMGRSAHRAIYAGLQDERWYLVRNLIAVLRMQKLPVDLDKILPLENHPHLRVNQEVLKLLFQHDRSRADSLLLKQLDSSDPKLRLHAVQLAELSQDPAIIERLIAILDSGKLTEESLPLKCQIIKTLAVIGREDGLPAQSRLLFSGKIFASARRLQLQKEILNHLDRYPYQAAKPLLQKMVMARRGELSKLATEKLRQLVRSSQ